MIKLVAVTVGLAMTSLLLVGCVSQRSDQNSRPAIPSPRPSADVFELTTGQCVDRPASATQVKNLTTVDCAKPHTGEIYKTFDIQAAQFHAASTAKSAAIAGCEGGFQMFAGISYAKSHRLTFWWIGPTTKSWSHGDRTVICAIQKLDRSGQPTSSTGTLNGANE